MRSEAAADTRRAAIPTVAPSAASTAVSGHRSAITAGPALVARHCRGAHRGRREIVGLDLGPSEAETFQSVFLRSLVRRGLRGMKLSIPDVHGG